MSCIKDDEPLNREADITSFLFSPEIMVSSNVKSENVTLIIRPDADITNLTPEITTTPGATVTPASGITQNFSDTIYYTVVSEDKNWSKKYAVIVEKLIVKDTILYDFNDWYITGTPPREFLTPSNNLWSSANTGIALALNGEVERYPTTPTEDAYKGSYAAYLQTQRGKNVFMPNNLISVFSGSLFTGKFELNGANYVKSAMFGQPHAKESGKPVLFSGYYKYKPGDVYYQNYNKKREEIIPGKIDECSIYAVLYKVTKRIDGEETKEEFLDGTDIMTSDKVIAKAIWPDGSAKESYTKFSVPFSYTEEPDYDRYDYKLAIVFASSKDGDFYSGAVGSTLVVDEVSIICEQY
ncbi:MAG: PCMD domain-containing protein [Dysgonomonas sp.]